jgi:hypothetical protein
MAFYALRGKNISMTKANNPIEIYLEIGKKRTIAGAVEWPGWCRVGRSEEDALAALVGYGGRYGRILAKTGLEFQQPADESVLAVVERLEGNATTDFGAPAVAPKADERPFDEAEHQRFQTILTACWQAFDEAVGMAEGKTLQKGPRGGGRELEAIREHLLESDRSYLSALGWKYKPDKAARLAAQVEGCRAAMLEGLAAAVEGEIAKEGPRGGKRWGLRYFVRRVTWHVLDHVWEIEDRVGNSKQ